MIRQLLGKGLDLSQLWRISRWYTRHEVRILMYHGVTDRPVPNWTQVSTEEFEQQMQYLRSAYTPVSLDHAEEMLAGSRPTVKHPVVVTFDDGFKNNVTQAYPILKKYQIPATIFIATSFLDRDDRFGGLIWTDYIYGLLEAAPIDSLDLRDQGLDRYDLGTEWQRYEAKGLICNQLKRFDFREKNRIIELVQRRLGTSVRKEAYEVFGPMSWEEARTLDREKLVSLGAHTVNHEILSRLPEEIMAQEIIGSQSRLEERLGTPVRQFAYPNGTIDDFTDQTARLVEQRFSSALTTIHGTNTSLTDRYKLRRIAIGRGTNLVKFKLGLSGILDLIRGVTRTTPNGQAY